MLPKAPKVPLMFDIVMLCAVKDAARVVFAETGLLSGCDRYINNS
jgi:hypothetical protein